MECLEARLNPEPLVQMIGKTRLLAENLAADLRKLKESESKGALQNHIHKVELGLSVAKNELQQQIYKMKEFEEQLFIRQTDCTQQLEAEVTRFKRAEAEIESQVAGVARELRQLRAESDGHKERTKVNAEAIGAILELEMLSSALEQQEEIDRRTLEDA